MNELTFDLRIKMTSDWHIGSGKGRHRSIDSLIDRDADGLPYVSASTIRGVWRDAAQMLAAALDAGPPPTTVWSEFVDTLFGSEPTRLEFEGKTTSAAPQSSPLQLDDAKLTAGIRSLLVGDSPGRAALREALTFIRSGIAIDRDSGRTRTDCLRFGQVSRRGLMLATNGIVELGNAEPPQGDQEAIVAFLVGAAALVDRLGGKRRRGLGRCSWTVTFPGAAFPSDGNGAADALEKALKNGGPPRNLAWQKREPQTFAFGAGKSQWTIYRLAITARAPIVVADEVQGNVITSQDSIPGTHLLGYVGRKMRTAVPDFWQRVAAGDIRVLPAYPDCNGDRGLPLPLVWSLPKNKSDGNALQLVAKGRDESGPQMKPVRQGFVTGLDPMSWLLSTKKSFKTHNTVLDETQRPDEEVGGVYTYEAIAARQVLHAEVWVRSSIGRREQLAEGLTGEATLGRARHSGYGRVSITAAPYVSRPLHKTEPGKLRIWLISDAILAAAAAHGRDAVRALQDGVAETLGKKTEDLFVRDGSAANWVNARWRRIESWQRQWGLPRPTLMALQAGSVAELALRPGVSVDTDFLASEGIGERRGEGYGAVHVDHPLLSCAPEYNVVGSTCSIDGVPVPLTADDSAVLERVHRRAWEAWITAAAETLMSFPKNRATILGWSVNLDGKASPPMSQIGGLRAAMGTLTSAREVDELEKLRNWAGHLAKVTNRKETWGGALAKLLALIGAPSDAWQHLAVDDERRRSELGLTPPPESWDGFEWRGDAELQRRAVYCLLTQAARFHKRDSEAAQQSQSEAAQ